MGWFCPGLGQARQDISSCGMTIWQGCGGEGGGEGEMPDGTGRQSLIQGSALLFFLNWSLNYRLCAYKAGILNT
jgi:hypothetical protein